MPSSKRVPHVAIIGAGVSGLRCADLLLDAGVQVTVFEARDRIGGRVHQICTDGHLVDVGANWIHSTNANPIMDIARETKTQVFWRPDDEAVVQTDGERAGDETATRLKETLWAYIDRAETYSAQHSAQIDCQLSLMDYIKEEATREFHTEPIFLQDLLNEAQRWGQFIGEPIAQQSLKFLSMEEGSGGTDVFLASTYKDILASIAKHAVAKDVIHLDTEVRKICYEDSDQCQAVCIETTDGERHEFDEVVVSCPLGWLKKNKGTAFSPSLSPSLSQAIDNISFGRLEKLYLTFPHAFWMGTTTPSPSDVATKAPYPCFTHFHDPSYGIFPPGLPSNVVGISMAHLPNGYARPTLLFYIHGPCAAKIVQSVQDLSRDSASYNKAIDTFARPYYSRLPNYSSEDPSCQPVAYFCSTWQLDRLAGNGSYSNIKVGTEHADRDVEVLRDGAGLGESRGVWFIGEHTAPASYMATTTGAYLSGQRGAAKILKKWSL